MYTSSSVGARRNVAPIRVSISYPLTRPCNHHISDSHIKNATPQILLNSWEVAVEIGLVNLYQPGIGGIGDGMGNVFGQIVDR